MLVLQPEVILVNLRPRPIFCTDLQFSYDPRCGDEYRFAATHLEAFDPAEVDRLHQLKKLTLRLGEGRLGWLVAQWATPKVKSRRCPKHFLPRFVFTAVPRAFMSTPGQHLLINGGVES